MGIEAGRTRLGESVREKVSWLKATLNPGFILGVVLVVTGVPATYFSYFIMRSVFPAAIWMSITLIGTVCLFMTFGRTNSATEARKAYRRELILIVVSLIVAFGSLNFILAAVKVTALSVYFIFDALAFLVLALAYHDFSRGTRARLNAAAALILVVFFALVVYKIKLMMG